MSQFQLNHTTIQSKICPVDLNTQIEERIGQKTAMFLGDGIHKLGTWLQFGGEKVLQIPVIDSVYPIGTTLNATGTSMVYVGNGIWFTSKFVYFLQDVYCLSNKAERLDE